MVEQPLDPRLAERHRRRGDDRQHAGKLQPGHRQRRPQPAKVLGKSQGHQQRRRLQHERHHRRRGGIGLGLQGRRPNSKRKRAQQKHAAEPKRERGGQRMLDDQRLSHARLRLPVADQNQGQAKHGVIEGPGPAWITEQWRRHGQREDAGDDRGLRRIARQADLPERNGQPGQRQKERRRFGDSHANGPTAAIPSHHAARPGNNSVVTRPASPTLKPVSGKPRNANADGNSKTTAVKAAPISRSRGLQPGRCMRNTVTAHITSAINGR